MLKAIISLIVSLLLLIWPVKAFVLNHRHHHQLNSCSYRYGYGYGCSQNSSISSSRRWRSTQASRNSAMLGQTNGSDMHSDVNDKIKGAVVEDIRRRQLLFFTSQLVIASSVGLVSPKQANAAQVVDQILSQKSTKDIIVPPLDDREYEAFTLSNGLRVLICSDPSLSTAAAAMDVHVGATSDPDTVPGLAHFNEHMLFLGTELYPEEGGFSAFLSANGGQSNAFTDTEDTVYYFDIAAGPTTGNAYNEALNRFGSFFSCPLFTPSATDRELNAINSENAKNLQNDSFRTYQIEKSRINRDHPHSKFYTGNKETLLDDTRKQHIDLRQELLKFYNRYYSSNQMTLALVGPDSLSSLKRFVKASFSDIPNRNVDVPEKAWSGVNPFEPGNSIIPALQHKVEIVPVTDSRQVTLSWPIIYTTSNDQIRQRYIKPDAYVAHLIGHEGKGSILSYIKKKGWANSLGASLDTEISDFSKFEVTVSLTKKGLDYVDDVCEAVFSFIRMANESYFPEYIFDEVLQINELEWRFLENGEPSGYVQSLVSGMNKFPPSLAVAGTRRISLDSEGRNESKPRMAFKNEAEREKTKQNVLELFSRLTLDNCMVTVLSKSFVGKTDKIEKWYGTAYRVSPLSLSTQMQWRNCQTASSLGIYFPRPNLFIPSEDGFRVKKRIDRKQLSKALSFDDRIKPLAPPTLIQNSQRDSKWSIWYKQDDRYGQPKAYVIFELVTPDAYFSPTNAVLSSLFDICLNDSLDEYAYDAILAGLTYSVQVIPRGVRLTFGGYNDKIEEFAAYISSKVARNFRDILPQSDSDLDRFKDSLARGLASFDTKQPYAHSIFYSALTMQPLRFQYSNKELREALKSVNLNQLENYVETLWSRGQGKALIQGNVNEREAIAIVNAVDAVIPFKTVSDEDIPPHLYALPLPLSKSNDSVTRIKISEPNLDNLNSASQVVFQCIGRSDKEHVLIELLNAVLEEAFYDDLRTSQQLGYIVSSGLKAIGESRNLSFIVQSNVVSAEKLTEAIFKFLSTVRVQLLEHLTDNDVTINAKALFTRKTTQPKTLAEETTRNWGEISSGRKRFDRIQNEAVALIAVTKEDLLSFWDYYFMIDGPGRRVLISETIPTSGQATSTKPNRSSGKSSMQQGIEGVELGIDDINNFRMKLQSEKDTVDGSIWID